jgi:hypothetical protein
MMTTVPAIIFDPRHGMHTIEKRRGMEKPLFQGQD